MFIALRKLTPAKLESNEVRILKSIKQNCKDKSIILISHRKWTTAICDKILELKNSKVNVVQESNC